MTEEQTAREAQRLRGLFLSVWRDIGGFACLRFAEMMRRTGDQRTGVSTF